MKKRRGNGSKKIFNSVNIILIALLFVELIFMFSWVPTGNPVKSVSLGDETGVTTTQSSLGTLVTKEGIVELIIEDNFENPELSKELYYLNENGKRYLLSTDSPLPVSAKIKVTGYLKDNVLSFSDSPTKDANLQGTGYTTTSTSTEPWPKTLGDQKYIVVYLFLENNTQFDVQNFTNITFSSVNMWINKTSYGKASVSYGYVDAFIFNYSNQTYNDIIGRIDPFINFNDYDGMVFYNLDILGNSGAGVGKHNYNTSDGLVPLYIINMFTQFVGTLIHEMGHNFGLFHAAFLGCGSFPNEKSLDNSCVISEYGSDFDVMGKSSSYHSYSLANKLLLGWISDENVSKVTKGGVYFIYPFEKNILEESMFYGLDIPLNWTPIDPYIDKTPGYFLEYRTQLNSNYFSEGLGMFCQNETTYGLNLSEISEGGILINIKLQYNLFPSPWPSRTYLLTTHPNSNCCVEGYCFNGLGFSKLFSLLLENESYYDPFNNMTITVLDMNESGALINITSDFICADINHDGIRDVIDVVKLVDYAFRGGVEPEPKWIGDMNGDNVIDVLDVVKLIDYAFRNGPEPTCTSQPIVTSSSATASLGAVSGTTTKTVPVNFENTENVAGTTFKISYDSTKLGTLKKVRTATRTTGMELIRNENMITIIKQDGSQTIPKGTGTIFYLDFTPPKTGFDTSSLKITEVKAANPKADKISVKIGSSTGVKSGASLS